MLISIKCLLLMLQVKHGSVQCNQSKNLNMYDLYLVPIKYLLLCYLRFEVFARDLKMSCAGLVRVRPGRLKVLCTFNLRPVSRGYHIHVLQLWSVDLCSHSPYYILKSEESQISLINAYITSAKFLCYPLIYIISAVHRKGTYK